MLFCSLLTFAQFSGSGSGTEDDPYLILNPIQLNQLRNFLNQEGVFFKMMADVDLTEFIEDENPSQGWQPIGNSSSAAFKGILDGNGKKISGLWINRSNLDYVGLFGYMIGATVKDLTIVANTLVGNDYVGGLSGFCENLNLSNISFSGKIQGGSNVGGIIGESEKNSTLLNIIVTTEINASGSNVGGVIGLGGREGTVSNGYDLIGVSQLSLSNSVVTVSLMTSGNGAGGLIGSGGGDISGCKVIDSRIVGCDRVGGACGWCSGSFSSCYFYADVTGKNYTGGICGSGTLVYMSNCGFVGNISGVSYCGGLIGNRSGDVGYLTEITTQERCFAIGSIVATGDYAGGLIGNDEGLYETGERYWDQINKRYRTPVKDYKNDILDCYFCGLVSGKNYTAGLVGYKEFGTISNSYSFATIAGSEYVGGLIGYNDISATIKTSVAINPKVTATVGEVARIVGHNEGTISVNGSTEENKAWNRTIVIKAGVAQDVTEDEQNGTGVSATTLKLKATYVAMGWDFTDTWEIQETESYPYFKTQTAPPVITSDVVSGATTISGNCVSGATVILDIDGVKQEKVFGGTSFSFTVEPLQAGHEVRVSAKTDGKEQSYFATAVVSYLGKGTEDDPYQISTAADLTCAYRKGYYKLMNDIDLTSYINQYSPTEGWESIGREGSETIYFDGDGHKITGLWCNSTRDNTGLFSCFANGYLKNLTVETASGKEVKGGSNTGILIGKMINGTIENCHVSGNVADGTPIGGIVGLLDGGKILLSKASVTINTTGDDTYVGGLVGDITNGEIDQCVTLGTIIATGKNSQAGGLVGKNAATVTNCYSNVAVTSAYCAAGLVSYNYGLVEKSYATGNLSSQNYGAGVIGYNDGENAIIRNCVAMNQRIDVTFESQSAQSGGYGQRVLGGYKNGAPDPEMNNYALKTMQLSVNDIPQKVYNDIMNGTAMTGDELMTASTYQTLGWDFTENWSIAEGESYPSLKNNVAEVKAPEKIVLKVTPPTAITGLVYSGKKQSLIEAGSTTIGNMVYSPDGYGYSKDIPTGIDAMEYTVYYRVLDDTFLTDPETIKVTISAKTVSSPTITLSETNYTYDGNAKEPTVTVKDGETTIPASEYTVGYSNNSNVGTATVTIADKEGGNYTVSGSTTFTISSADGSLTPPTAKSGLVYSGTAQDLITAGSSTTGTMQYSLDGTNYSTSIPQGTDAKEYTVYYKVVANAGYNDVAPASFKVTIAAKTVSSPTITLSETSYTYDGNAKKPTVTVKDGETTIPASEYTVGYSNNTNIGTATVTIKDMEGGNYIINGSTTFEIIADPTQDETETIKISTAKQVTYMSDKNLDFTTKPELKAYVATGYDKTSGTIWLTRVKYVPAKTGFLLMGDASDYEIPVKTGDATSYYMNLFKGTIEGKTIYTNEGDNTNYYLSDGESGVGFYKVQGSVTLKANRAYLSVPTEISAVGTTGNTEMIQVSSAGQVPYYNSESLDFSSLAAQGVKAYTATGYDYSSGTIWLTRVMKVPAKTGMLIMAPKGDYPVPTASVASVYRNMFKGTLSGTRIFTHEEIEGRDYINYYLSNGTSGVGFYKVTAEEGVELKANRSYLPILNKEAAGTRSAGSGQNQIAIEEADEVIGIQLFRGTTNLTPALSQGEGDGEWYTLQGQRVTKPGKGLYIRNGKVVVIK